MSAADPRPGTARPIGRRVAVPVLLVAVLVPYALTFLALWSRTGDDLETARRERAGVIALRPLVTLLAVTTDAQTQAVAGEASDPAPLRSAVAAVDTANAAVGAGLGTDRRWADLRSRLSHIATTESRDAAAYTAFSQVVDLELALLAAVGDASGLRVDPQIDSHYLADAALVQSPTLIVSAGRISDLTLLLERRQAPVKPDTLAVAVAQAELRSAARQLDEGLHQGLEAPGTRGLGLELLGELDRLRDATSYLAPPVSEIGAIPSIRRAAATQNARVLLRAAILETSTAALDQLTELLEERADTTTATRRTVIAVTGIGLAVVLAVTWIIAPRRQEEDRSVDLPSTEGAARGAPEVDGAGDVPRAGAQPPDSGEPVSSEDLIEARDLLEERQLLRVGRAVTASPKKDPPPPEEDS